MRLNYTAPDHVQKVIAGLGRTEDVKFSPNNCRLAVVSFGKNQIAIFDICIAGASYEREITLTDAIEISSPYFKYPHGIDFIDEERIIVATERVMPPSSNCGAVKGAAIATNWIRLAS